MNDNKKKSVGIGITLTLVSLIIILLVSNVWVYFNLQNQVSSLTIENDKVQSQLNSLNTTFIEYRATHIHSNTEYALLENDLNSLEQDYSNLVSDYNQLFNKHESAMQDYRRVSSQIKEFKEEQILNIYIPEAFSRAS